MRAEDTHASWDPAFLDQVIREFRSRLAAGENVAAQKLLDDHPGLRERLVELVPTLEISQPPPSVPAGDSLAPSQHPTVIAPTGSPAPHAVGVQPAAPTHQPSIDGPFPVSFGKYRIDRLLGRGGMGEVYLAEDVRLGRKVAIKVPRHSMSGSADDLARFLREARAAAALRHHNLCPVFEVDEAAGIHYIAMAFIEGRSLSEVIREEGVLAPRAAAAIVRKIAQALEVAHRAGIIHRDLKPANVMIDRDGEPIVMDFGLARQVDTSDQSQLTLDGVIVGTPAYMAPEQVRGESGRIGPASDVYSLGVILFELLTGRLPFTGATMTLLMDVAAEDRVPPRPSTLRRELDPRLEAVCLRMLAKPMSARYASMRDVSAALSGFLDGSDLPETAVLTPAPATGAATTEAADTRAEFSNFLMQVSSGTAKAARPRRRTHTWAWFVVPGVLAVVLATVFSHLNRDAERDGRKTNTLEGPGKANPVSSEELSWHGWPSDAPRPAIAPFNADEATKHQAAWAEWLKVPVEYENSIGMKFRLIPPGEFLMGADEAEAVAALKEAGGADESVHAMIRSFQPQHRVILTHPFYLGVFEVTHKEFEAVMPPHESRYKVPGIDKSVLAGIDIKQRPMDSIDWIVALDLCEKLTAEEHLKPSFFRLSYNVTILSGEGYRLPTEAEWEYACRAGTTSKWWSGDEIGPLKQVAWTLDNAGAWTHDGGELGANPFGLFDVHGNLAEWVQDQWDEDSYEPFRNVPAVNPTGPDFTEGKQRILRGGAWNSPVAACASYYRQATFSLGGHAMGVRVALPVEGVRRTLKLKGPPLPSRPSTKMHREPSASLP